MIRIDEIWPYIFIEEQIVAIKKPQTIYIYIIKSKDNYSFPFYFIAVKEGVSTDVF